ncbi:MAG: flagellar motor control protein ZomB [Corynebacterium striatum]|nr:flagellar motor control protein ZomB [Corynebacterium striatum]
MLNFYPVNNTNNKNLVRLSAAASVIVIGVFSFWGGFVRRWISDDGLIVLRTVRNLEAGNGPVFNMGERVEANTSTLWQYLILLLRWITGADLAGIAIYLGLFLAVCAMALGAFATAGLVSRGKSATLVAPAGALVYLALPPARDFFTSGLEWGLAIFYLAVLWWMLLKWARGVDKHAANASDSMPYWLAVWAGLSWLVRPELALYGGLVGVLLLAAHRNWKAWLGILAAALPLPLGYQIFRMGYYGLLTPHTAVAKSASGAVWSHGFNYLGDFALPYALYVPLIVLAAWALWSLRRELRPSGFRTPATAAYLLLAAGLLHLIYVLRVGGDFMHGRMLLLPLFALLLPVFVLPLRSILGGLTAAICAVWACVIVLRGHSVDWDDFSGPLNIVDEREFWTHATKRQTGHPPRSLEDFGHMRFIEHYKEGMDELEAGDALAVLYAKKGEEDAYGWMGIERDPSIDELPTVYFINMGMTSMNAPLEVRVLDDIGLATPLAARQPRIADGRIGHDKSLPTYWQAAQTAVDIDELPSWYDKEETRKARKALQTEDFQKLFATYKDPLDAKRFFENIKFALTDGRTLTFSEDPGDYLGK